MERFGEDLRGERERRGVTIETICSVTKISSRHLQALEANRFSELPGGVFRKGIVRGYLATLGLEESGWMPRFEDALRSSGCAVEVNTDWTEFAENVRRQRLPSSNIMRGRWLGVLAMLLVLALLTFFAWVYVVRPNVVGPHVVGPHAVRPHLTQSGSTDHARHPPDTSTVLRDSENASG